MGRFLEDFVHQLMDITMEDDDQRALKVRGNVARVKIAPVLWRMCLYRQNFTS
jgi:hypothetical protein